METRNVPITELHHDPANTRAHDERNLATIKASLKEFGQVEPLIVQKGTGKVIGGNGRLSAMQALGVTHADIYEVDLTDAKAAALSIALNRTAELASWDDAALATQLAALQNDEAINELVTGFDGKEIQAIIDQATGADVVEDEAPEPPAYPETQPGDLWALGEHRLLCGDSTKAEDVGRLMGKERASMVFTDPPYGVNYSDSGKARIQGDMTQVAIPLSFKLATECATDASARMYWCGSNKNAPMFFALFDAHCNCSCSQLIWVKPQFVLMHHNYHSQFEVIFFGWKGKGGGKDCWFGDRKQSDVWQEDRAEEYQHPTQKPIGLPAKAIGNSLAGGSIVLDPFLGSGTTLIAAEQLGRKCYGIEISPAYCDVIIQRWENLTGKTASKISD